MWWSLGKQTTQRKAVCIKMTCHRYIAPPWASCVSLAVQQVVVLQLVFFAPPLVFFAPPPRPSTELSPSDEKGRCFWSRTPLHGKSHLDDISVFFRTTNNIFFFHAWHRTKSELPKETRNQRRPIGHLAHSQQAGARTTSVRE